MALKVARMFSPKARFDIETFVLKDDLKEYPGLIYEKDKIFYQVLLIPMASLTRRMAAELFLNLVL